MFADELRIRFLTDVIMPLCDQYGKEDREGWRVYNASYYEHRQQQGSLALCPDREARMEERVGYMMVQFFKWLHADSPTHQLTHKAGEHAIQQKEGPLPSR